jgi:hypothetical protein
MSLDEVSKFRNLQKFDSQKCLIDDFAPSIESNSRGRIAKFIHQNIHLMDDVEKRRLLTKLLDDKKVSSDLMKYELRYLNLGRRISDFNEFIKFVREALSRYHMKAGGYLCEDTEWSEHSSSSSKYPLKPNEVIFENSIKKTNRFDLEVTTFIYDLLNFFYKHKVKGIQVSYRLIEYTDQIYLMVFKITDRKN